MRAALFVPCYVDTLFPEVGVATLELRGERAGLPLAAPVVLLDPAEIVPTMHDAYRRREEFDAAYGVFMTGPSATADIEGVLIHGAQGVRSLTVAMIPRGYVSPGADV